MPSNVDAAAYRIVQEALTNVVHHAHARHATVDVFYSLDGVRVQVADDGIGLPALPGGSGLENMRTRAMALGGTLTAGPAPGGGGFEVVATLPSSLHAGDVLAGAIA